MHRHGITSSSISIEFPDLKSYCPGDSVTGTITATGKSIPSVQLKLLGRANTRIEHLEKPNHGNAFIFHVTENYMRDNCQVIEGDDGTTTWPFDLQIPSVPIRDASLEQDRYPTSTPFLSNTGPVNAIEENLPATFYYNLKDSREEPQVEAFVEYWLEATSEDANATHPIAIRPKWMPYAIQDFHTVQQPRYMRIQSYNVHIQSERTDLNRMQRLRVALKPSALSPLESTWDGLRTYSGDLASLRTVRVERVAISLRSDCHVRGHGATHDRHFTRTTELPIGAAQLAERLQIPAIRGPPADPRGFGFERHEDRPGPPPGAALSLGPLLGARLSRRRYGFHGREKAAASGDTLVQPDFDTYNISLRHTLVVMMDLLSMDYAETVVHESPLHLLPPPKHAAGSEHDWLDGTDVPGSSVCVRASEERSM